MYSNYPSGFAGGLTVRNVPIVNTTPRKTWWVGNNSVLLVGEKSASDGNKGDFLSPFSTLNYAITQASPGDTIYVRPSQAESLTAAGSVTVGIANLTIIGLGNGTTMPTYTSATSTAATFLISAANVRVKGLRFRCNIASQTTMVSVTATDATIEDCDFAEGSATGLSFIAITGSANAADRLRILNNRFFAPTAGNYNHAIGINEVNDKVEIAGNWIYGNFALSGLHNITGKVATNISVHDNYIRNLTAAKPAMNFISAVTGEIHKNVFIAGDTTVAPVTPGSCTVGGGNIDNWGPMDAGSTIDFVKTLTSSAITQAGVDIMGAASGALEMVRGSVQTDSTGLAAMTNFTLVSNNSKGLLTFFSQAITGLGANKTVEFTAGATAGALINVESTKKITAKATAADGTGAGTIDIYITFRRITAGACPLTV